MLLSAGKVTKYTGSKLPDILTNTCPLIQIDSSHPDVEPAAISVEGCGETKGCYRVPQLCEPPRCDIVVTWNWKEAEGLVEFEHGQTIAEEKEKAAPWIALGFANVTEMVGDTFSVQSSLQFKTPSFCNSLSFPQDHPSMKPLFMFSINIPSF